MSETVVRVELRQATLSESARLRDAGELLFLAIENPPPVRSLLSLRDGDERKAFEVARVVEVVDEDESARGCYGREVPVERLDEQVEVGSEHLEPGITGGGGVPAPVVIMNTSEMMIGEAGEDGERAAEGEDDEGSNDEGSDGEGSDGEGSNGESSDGSNAESSDGSDDDEQAD